MTYIGDHPLPELYQSGREVDCQCARCGSSCDWVDCDNCDDGDCGSDCIDDLCHGGECIHGDSGQLTCDFCRGRGGWQACQSSPEWCEANPMPGRQLINRGMVEWFSFKERP